MTDFFNQQARHALVLSGAVRPNNDEESDWLNFRMLDGAVEDLKKRWCLGVRFECFNKKEAQAARKYLDEEHPEYANKFQMTWMNWRGT